MKLSKLTFAVVLGLALSACSNMSNDGSLDQAKQTYQNYQDITKQFSVDEQWWHGYNDPQLNELVEQAIKNNLDLAKSAISVNRALYNANLVGANLVPTFSGSASSSASKGVGSSNNTNSVGTSTVTNTASFNLSYTIDLWRRLADSASAAEWEHKATQEDLKAARLSLINSVVATYYQIAYYKDAIAVTNRTIKNYEQISNILNNKLKVGARNSVVGLETSLKTAEKTMRNLLNLQPNQPLPSRYPNILNVKLQGVDTNVPVSAIANRPDVAARLNRLQSAFKTLTATEKSWFPTLTLGGAISGSARSASNVGDNPIANGMFSFDLPFLDWNRVKNNVKISEADYTTARMNYEQTITTALNEIDSYYYTYNQSRSSFGLLEQTYEKNRKISTYYQNRYNQGVAEFRDWISAMNTELSSQISLLNQKYTILMNENLVYQAMAGKYSR